MKKANRKVRLFLLEVKEGRMDYEKLLLLHDGSQGAAVCASSTTADGDQRDPVHNR